MNQFLAFIFVSGSIALSTGAQAEMLAGEIPLKPIKPYVFSTVGTAQDGLKTLDNQFNTRDTSITGQVGLGIQTNDYLGGEIYYQSGESFHYSSNPKGSNETIRAKTFGARGTIGTNTRNRGRIFAKLGVATVKHDSNSGIHNDTRPRFIAGIGATYHVNQHFAVRGDYDHLFKRHTSVDSKGSDYVGIGGQMNF